MMNSVRGRVSRQDRGAAAVEMAIICPILIAVLAGVVDFGMMLYQQTVVVTAADAGALYAIVNGYNQANIENAVQNSYDNVSFSAVSASPAPSQFCGCALSSSPWITQLCTSSCTFPCAQNYRNSCGSGSVAASTYVQVNAQSSYTPIVPWTALPWSYAMGPGAVTLKATSTVELYGP
jgi:Flp pilus assembly protein TadG